MNGCCCYTIAALVNAVADELIAVTVAVLVTSVAVVFAVIDDIAVPAITAVAFVANTVTDPLSDYIL
jgi:hypothetical protein